MGVDRYHPALVVLHWLLALLLVFALAMGTFVLQSIPNTSPDKLAALQGHMIGGGLILVLMLVRLAVRWRTARPPAVSTGNALIDRVAPLVHAMLYLLVFVMAGSGIAMSVGADLPGIVFQSRGALPPDFSHLPTRALHGFVAQLLIALIALHALAALYHQFIRRDGLIGRMRLGRR